MELKVQSNGHDYVGISYVSDVPFILIDLLCMNSIDDDVKQGSEWVEAGATLSKVYYNIANKSRTYGFSAGICPTVGVGGHIGGGDFGTMVRKYGLVANNVVDALIVNADGETLNKTSMGDDLF
ncbi:hypothetical protein Syun_029492 [Stephania yunnanensis]|uniref:FAD-binding PCMH-type domain-containing protein n=1 Tax=Stephania yunnanensis TaxID=152371 RepID=A0AAP0EDA4_9MAGN